MAAKAKAKTKRTAGTSKTLKERQRAAGNAVREHPEADRKGKPNTQGVSLAPVDTTEVTEALEAVIGDGAHWLLDTGCSICGLLWDKPDEFVKVNQMLTARKGERPTQGAVEQYVKGLGVPCGTSTIRRHRTHMKEVGFWTALLGKNAERLIEESKRVAGGKAPELIRVLCENLLMKLLVKANSGKAAKEQLGIASLALRYLTAAPRSELTEAKVSQEKRKQAGVDAMVEARAGMEVASRLESLRGKMPDDQIEMVREALSSGD